MIAAKEIKDFALEIGFCRAGISAVKAYDRVVAEAQRRGHYEYWMDRFRFGADPKNLLPGARSVVVLAYDYACCDYPEKLTRMIGRAYLSRSYLPQAGSRVRGMLDRFEEFLREAGVAFVSDQNTLMMRPAAEAAGVASFGQNNFAYVDGVGSFVILFGYVLDCELECDVPADQCQCPLNCRACVKACPTGALIAPFRLDPSRCIGYNNWMRQEGKVSDVVPREIRPQLGCHIHGCDLCQEACPRNRARLKETHPREEMLEQIAERLTLPDLLHMPEGFYEECVRPIMYNYIRDPKYFQRNAAIAMGNLGDPAFLPDLIEELSNPEEVVRIHVAWALGQMHCAGAVDALRARLCREASTAVREEIEFALRELQEKA